MSAEDKKKQTEIDIHLIKTSGYRTYYIDGAFGGPTPAGNLYLELFIDRASTPQITRFKITPDGFLGEEVHRVGKSGAVREIEAGLVMNIDVAKGLRDWLNENIETLEKIKEKKR